MITSTSLVHEKQSKSKSYKLRVKYLIFNDIKKYELIS